MFSSTSSTRALASFTLRRRRVARGRLEQAGEQRRLRQRDEARRPAEIAARGGLDPVGAAAEIDAIEIELEDLLLGEALLEPHRIDHLFAACAVMVRSGRRNRFLASCWVMVEPPSTTRRPRRCGTRRGPARRVDAEMRVEAAVLGGEHRLHQVRRQHFEPHMAPAQAPLGEHGAVLGQHGDIGRPVVERGDGGSGTDAMK